MVGWIPYYRFISLNVRSEDGETYDAVFPLDHAIPELIKRQALKGWPPEDIVKARGGLPLVSDWDEPPEESRVDSATHVRVDDVNEFLAAPWGARDEEMSLSSANVEALLSTGRTIVRREEGPPVVVEVTPSGMASHIVSNGEMVVGDLPALLGTDRNLLPLSETNIGELRDH